MQVLGDYRILEELGRGGMGVVYKAQDQKLGRLAAVKVLPRDVADDPKRFARFEREAKGAAAVTHPNITTIYAFGNANGWPYMVFEFMAGGSLDHRLRNGPIPWREALTLMAPIARGLGAIHAAGFIHRDMKPANILLDAAGRPKISDFGLVRHGATQRGSLTGTELVGTVSFLSPEQTGEAVVDFRADFYSLGATLYALLTGRPPFLGEGLQVITQHLTAKVTPPSEEVEGIPPDVDALVIKLLAKKPAQRGESGDAIADEMEAILERGAETKVSRGRKRPEQRSKSPALVIGIATFAVIGMGALLLLRGNPPENGHDGTPPPSAPVSPVAKPSFTVVVDEPGAENPAWDGSPVRVRGRVEGKRAAEVVEVFVNGEKAAWAEGRFEAILKEDARSAKVDLRVPGAAPAVEDLPLKRVPIPSWWTALEERPKLPLPRGLRPTGRMTEGMTPEGEKLPGHPIYEYRWKDLRMDMVHVPAGEFLMGWDRSGSVPPEDQPQHRHPMDHGYFIGRYEVTWLQFQAYTDDADPKQYPSRPNWQSQPGDNHPVVNVSWDKCNAFCEWAKLRLPTEAQWEKAARGTDGRLFPWGNRRDYRVPLANLGDRSCPLHGKPNFPYLEEVDWDDGYPQTSPVGVFPIDTSPYGVSDMVGNAAEFCEEWYDPDAYKRYAKGDFTPLPKATKKVVRGSSWCGNLSNGHTFLRYGGNAVAHHEAYDHTGFRAVLSED